MNIQWFLVLSSRWQCCTVLMPFIHSSVVGSFVFHYPACKADIKLAVFGSDFREEPKSLSYFQEDQWGSLRGDGEGGLRTGGRS